MSYTITENCTGCTLCARNCPVYAITGELKSTHTINEKRCIDCGVCGRVCPADAIIDNNSNKCQKLSKTEWEKPKVDEVKCSACGLCVDICTLDCLEISEPTFKGDIKAYATLADEKKCVSCKMCADVCPLNAISMEVTI